MNANPGQQPEQPITSSMATKVYTTREACEVLSIGKTFLFDLIRGGQLRSFKTRHKRYVSATAINEYIQCEPQNEVGEHRSQPLGLNDSVETVV